MIWIILIAALVIFILVFKHIKRLKYGNLTLISGGVKTGKTMLSVCLCIKQYKKQLRKWRWKKVLCFLQGKPQPEKPLLYSNMPIGKIEYAPLTLDLITGKERFRYGSVVYFNECSLIVGSKDIKDEDLNDYLLKFFKLCAHETRGGYFFLDTQSPQDLHYTIKRSMSTYYYIYRSVKLPFVSLLWLRENILVDGDTTVAIDTQSDPQDSVVDGGKPMYFRIIRHKWWRYYDQYAYSVLTDGLPVADKTIKTRNLKMKEVVRCRDLKRAVKKQ